MTIRDALVDLIEQCSGDHRRDCPIIDELSGEEGVPDAPSVRPRHSSFSHSIKNSAAGRRGARQAPAAPR
jgi:hypothetical protein